VARVDGRDRYFLQESIDEVPDRVVLDRDGFVLSFPSETAAREAGELCPEEVSVYDLDALEAWCKSADEVGECSVLLAAWNLLNDLHVGDGLFVRAEARATATYDKLFWGSNLPAMTPPGEHYTPSWSASELAALKHVLLLGLAELRGRLR
jgi:hypothetical protein